MKRIFTLPLLIICLLSNLSQAQDYRAPLDIPLVLSGTFGELRSSHFHSGIDIKTQGRIGLPVFAIADGYVSRIKISTGGYGKAIYITHPTTGHTSVYAHLNEFTGAIAEYVREMQYARESFEIELFPDPARLQVLKGQEIAKSGNTGGSFGPHLHFEVRKTDGSIPLNPLQFGFDIKDSRSPELRRLFVYALNEQGAVVETVGSFPINSKKELSLRVKLPSPYLGIGIEAYDKQDLANNLNGNYQLEVLKDGEAFFGYKLDAFSFSETRFLNNFIDYQSKMCCGHKTQKMFKSVFNPLSVYQFNEAGIIKVDSTSTFNFKVVAKDFAGNSSSLNLSLNVIPGELNEDKELDGQEFKWNAINNFISDSLKVYTSKKSFYHDFNFQAYMEKGNPVAPIYNVHHLEFPVHKYMRVLIKGYELAYKYKDQVYAVSLDSEGNDIREPGNWEEDFYAIKTRSFGKYTLRIDSLKPSIEAINLPQSGNYTGGKLRFRIKDEGSGIKSYRASVNAEFILFEFEAKQNLLFYIPDGKLPKGQQTLKIQVSDYVGNTTVKEFKLNNVSQ